MKRIDYCWYFMAWFGFFSIHCDRPTITRFETIRYFSYVKVIYFVSKTSTCLVTVIFETAHYAISLVHPLIKVEHVVMRGIFLDLLCGVDFV